MIPISGSAYTYAYATLGEIFAWMIGWDLILEYAVGSMTVAVGWSGYFQRILAGFGVHLPAWMSASPDATAGTLVNIPAMLIVLGIMVLLVVGVRESARFNAAMVTVKLAAVAFFILDRLHVREARELVAVHAVRLLGRDDRRGGRLLCVHRVRRGFDDRRRGEESQPRSADRHHRVADHLHVALPRSWPAS